MGSKTKKVTDEREIMLKEVEDMIERAIAEDLRLVASFITGGGVFQKEFKPDRFKKDEMADTISISPNECLMFYNAFKDKDDTKPNPQAITEIRKEILDGDTLIYTLVYYSFHVMLYAI